MKPVEFMQTLKVGDAFDTVYRVGFRGHNKEATTVVVRNITKTQIVISGLYGKEERYYLANGCKRGDHFEKFPLPATPEQVREAKEDKEARSIRSALDGYKWDTVALPELRAIRAILKGKQEVER